MSLKKTTVLAKIAFISGAAVVPIGGLPAIAVKMLHYHPIFEMFGPLVCLSLILVLVSLLTGFSALVHIALNRGRLRGVLLAIAGIILSVASSVVYGHILISDMFEKMMV